jgi:serine/threonine protein kinase
VQQYGPLPPARVVHFLRQLCGAQQEAHTAGLVHRDIKPSNILLENGVERAKISDFGLARAVDDTSLTQSGVVAGTPEYMAPEQACGESVDRRTDLFSLGSVLYAICAGRPPFRARGFLAVLKRVCEDTPRPLREINPDLPEWLCELIAKLHTKKLADRFSSAGGVADLLCRGLSGQSPSVPLLNMEVASPQPFTPTVSPGKRRLRWLAVGVPVLLAATFGLTENGGLTNNRGTVLHLFSSEGNRFVPTSKEVGPLTEAERWEKTVAENQVEAVVQLLRELNPDFDGKVKPDIMNGVVRQLQFLTDEVEDISPLRVVKGLESLNCEGTYPSGRPLPFERDEAGNAHVTENQGNGPDAAARDASEISGFVLVTGHHGPEAAPGHAA